MNCQWIISPPQAALAASLAAAWSVSPLFAQCLINRNTADPEAVENFLRPRLKALSDPFLLPGMRESVDRLYAARSQSEPLLIFGDYDADGITSTAMMAEVLTALGWKVHCFLPNRLDDGYGLSKSGLAKCLEKHPVKLLLALDCGANASETIAWLNGRGVDVIVLDHHKVSDPPPAALAMVNPQLISPADPGAGTLSYFCTAGLAFKLAHALLKRGRELEIKAAHDFDLRSTLDLAALGTVADLVPLLGENRILVSAGLARLEETSRPGLRALKSIAQVNSPVDVSTVSFQLGPRLNAAGRLEDPTQALRLLLSSDEAEAQSLARLLDERNRERQSIERMVSEDAIKNVRARFDPRRDFVIVEGQSMWHIGVVGIVASRVLRQFYRPTVIVGGEGDLWRGSGRSIPGFDLAEALDSCDDLLLRHGGHALAAGLTVQSGNLTSLRERLNQLAHQRLTSHQLKPLLLLDAIVPLSDMTGPFVENLGRLEPTGQGNPPVQLATRHVSCLKPPLRMGRSQQHVKMWVTDGTASCEAVWWGAGSMELPRGSFELAFAPKINDYNGQRTVQLNILDWRSN